MAPRNNRGKGKNGEKKKKEEKDESSVVLKVYQPTEEELRSYLDPYKSVMYQVKIEVYADCALR